MHVMHNNYVCHVCMRVYLHYGYTMYVSHIYIYVYIHNHIHNHIHNVCDVRHEWNVCNVFNVCHACLHVCMYDGIEYHVISCNDLFSTATSCMRDLLYVFARLNICSLVCFSLCAHMLFRLCVGLPL